MSHSLGGPSPPAQWTSPETLLRNDGQAKQTRNPTSCFTTGQSSLSFFNRPIAFAPATPLRVSVTAFGTFLHFCDGYPLTKHLISNAIALRNNTLTLDI